MDTISGFELNEKGQVTSHNFHDGYLTRIDVSGEKRAVLGLRTEPGGDYEMELRGVERLMANDFRQGNIIFDISVEQHMRTWSRTSLYRFFDASPEHPEAAPWVQEYQDRLERGELCLVKIVASYGCCLSALCHRVELRKISID